MKTSSILEAMTDIDPAYILSAQQKLGYWPEAQGRRTVPRMLALAAAVLVMMTAMLTSALALSPQFRETVLNVIETLFPPKELLVTPEGIPETVPHSAQGKEPEAASTGFAIYVDDERYSMTEENGVFYVRPIGVELSREAVRKDQAALLEGLPPAEQEAAIDRRMAELEAFYAALPVCEMEIREFPDMTPEAAAETARTQMAGSWDTISETERGTQPPYLYVSASGGSSWDSPQEEHYFCPNGREGAFHITLRYFLEAAEGHGTRFHAMLDTFTPVSPQDAAGHGR